MKPESKLLGAAAAMAAFFITTAEISGAESKSIPLDQLGAVATQQVEGNSLSITPAENGARLRCAFQRLEGRATPEGLWLTSTTDNSTSERFQVVATSVGRTADPDLSGLQSSRDGGQNAAASWSAVALHRFQTGDPLSQSARGLAHSKTCRNLVWFRDTNGGRQVWQRALPRTGTVSVGDKVARFTRPGLVEEYSVSVDGVRQDFVIESRPLSSQPPVRHSASDEGGSTFNQSVGALRVELALSGATAEPTAYGAKLTLDGSGRTLAYSRLRATDATGRELSAGMEVLSRDRLTVHVDDANAIYPIRIDPTFSDADWVSLNPEQPGVNGWVDSIVADDSGNVYFGGAFRLIGTVAAKNIAKWDGSEWSALGSGTDNPVYALALSGAGLYVGGAFTTAGGVAVNHIAKWDGSNWSTLGSGVGKYVYALAVIGTDLYAGGAFWTAGGTSANNIAKWNGSSWSALGSGTSGTVWELATSGTDLYAGGDFTTVGGVSANYIAKWDGSTWSALGSGMGGDDPTVYALAVSGTELYAGGKFVTAGGLSANGIARWDGSAWSALGSGVDDEVWALVALGTDLYVGGYFGTAGGVAANNIAKWDGSTWSALGSGLDEGVDALSVVGTDIYVGGYFNAADGVPAVGIARWDGSSWSAFGSGITSYIDALTVSGTDLYAAPWQGGTILKWNGSTWSSFTSAIDGYVWALAMMGTDLYAGGSFGTAGGVPAHSIAKWDGSTWSPLGSGVPDSSGGVRSLAVSGTDLYVGGGFTTAGGVAANHIAKWDGSSWSALGSGVNDTVIALAIGGTDLYAGGSFTTAGGVAANHIAKWDGSTWSDLGSGVDDLVWSLAASGTDLFAGGYFTTAGGVPANRIAKWNGSIWSALGSGMDGAPVALAVSGSDLYAGGRFTTAGGVAVNNIAKWNGTSWSALGSGITEGGANPGVMAMAVDEQGRLFVGGLFDYAGTNLSPYIAQANILGLDLTWDAISSPQEVDVPFPVSITAKSYAGAILTNFSDTVGLFGYAPGVVATNISIGAGTTAWGYPLYTRYHDARTQVLYLTNELGHACTLNSLALEVVTPPGRTLENWTIRLKHTSLTEYPLSPEWEGDAWTVVYQGNEPAGTAGWRTFAFSTPFDYDGTNNLLIDFSFNNDAYTSEGQCRSTVMDVYRSLTFASDSKNGDPLSWSGTTPTPVHSYNVPNLMLGTSYPDLLPVPLSPTVTTPFVYGVWTGEVTVHEAASNLVLRADDGLGHTGESNPFDVLAPEPPVIVTEDGQLGITNGCFGFHVQGQAGQVVVIEVTTNLVDWLPLQTNTLGSSSFYFSDPDPTNFTQRFYRAVTP